MNMTPKPISWGPIQQSDLVRYAGASGDFNPIHYDAEAAQVAGFPRPIAQGMYTAGILAAAVEGWFPDRPVAKFSTRFRLPVSVGDVVETRCVSLMKAGDGLELELDVVRGGDVVVTGHATLGPSRSQAKGPSGAGMPRDAIPSDRAAFLEMWGEFVATDPDEPGDREMGETNWQRTSNVAGSLKCLIVEDDAGTPSGFLLYNVFDFTWSKKPICYLQDIHVRSQSRGKRLGQKLIEFLADRGRANGWYKIFWMTQRHNTSAQKLYQRVATERDYIRFDLMIDDP